MYTLNPNPEPSTLIDIKTHLQVDFYELEEDPDDLLFGYGLWPAPRTAQLSPGLRVKGFKGCRVWIRV